MHDHDHLHDVEQPAGAPSEEGEPLYEVHYIDQNGKEIIRYEKSPPKDEPVTEEQLKEIQKKEQQEKDEARKAAELKARLEAKK
jgi:hypothetical protein